MHTIKNGQIKDFIGKNLLTILGENGSGKTHFIMSLIPELLRQGKRVGVIDFRQEFNKMTEALQGESFSGEYNSGASSSHLIRLHFSEDIYYSDAYLNKQRKLNFNVLSALIEDIDYLIVDECNLLNTGFVGSRARRSITQISDICKELFQRKPELKIVLALQNFNALSPADAEELDSMSESQLLFNLRNYPSPHSQLLQFLKVGEAIYLENGRLDSVFCQPITEKGPII